MTIKFKDITILQIAKLGTQHEEYIYDGIRSVKIREPGPARVAALTLIREGQLTLGGDELIREEYMPLIAPMVTKHGTMIAYALRILEA